MSAESAGALRGAIFTRSGGIPPTAAAAAGGGGGREGGERREKMMTMPCPLLLFGVK